MNKTIAITPPMGWNSWDCYGASVTEDEVRGNAEYMAKHLAQFGWQYIVVDIQWYESTARTSAYNPFAYLEMDDFGRLIPAVNRFPSAKDGKGFEPLAEFVHGLGLKFGIHAMRGIPRQAVHHNTRIPGTEARSRDIAHPNSICWWNTDMYGVDPCKQGAQAYYDSVFELYASWGVDYVKVDDIANSYNPGEIELIHYAIKNCGREMVLSLSPGPTPIEQAEHVRQHANLWRMTGDFWDRWEDLHASFDKCNMWSKYVGPNTWPDADMLPLGHIGIRSCEHGIGDRWTRFTRVEQITLVSLWCIFRSPLMFGGELRDNDDWTLSLLTNPEVLRVQSYSHSSRQLSRTGIYGDHVVWTSIDEDGSFYLALFNCGTLATQLEVQLSRLGISGSFKVRDLWKRETLFTADRAIALDVPSHGARLVKLSKIQG
jgi:alpha-galactosidase